MIKKARTRLQPFLEVEVRLPNIDLQNQVEGIGGEMQNWKQCFVLQCNILDPNCLI
jgi:hypothetical protein